MAGLFPNPLDFSWAICKKCGKGYVGHWLSDGYCRECYIEHKIGISPALYDYIISDEFQNACIKDKFSMLSDWEEEHPEDREICEKLKKILAEKIEKINKLQWEIVKIENEAKDLLKIWLSRK